MNCPKCGLALTIGSGSNNTTPLCSCNITAVPIFTIDEMRKEFTRSMFASAEDLYKAKIEHLEQQLLATQEAYQRVVEAVGLIRHKAYMGETGIFAVADEALANPPSLEAVERKKLGDEIDVLEFVYATQPKTGVRAFLLLMINERKTKLEKIK